MKRKKILLGMVTIMVLLVVGGLVLFNHKSTVEQNADVRENLEKGRLKLVNETECHLYEIYLKDNEISVVYEQNPEIYKNINKDDYVIRPMLTIEKEDIDIREIKGKKSVIRCYQLKDNDNKEQYIVGIGTRDAKYFNLHQE